MADVVVGIDRIQSISDKVFDLLCSEGDLCVGQISGELVLPLADIQDALHSLEKQGLVEEHADSDQSRDWNQLQIPYGLPRLKLKASHKPKRP